MELHSKYFFYCPLCRIPRLLKGHPNAGQWFHYVQVGLTTALLAALCWPLFGPKGAVLFVPVWIVFEFYYRMKTRERLVCHKCGFDPVLYLSDVDEAKQSVENHWRKKYQEKGLEYPKDKYLRLSQTQGASSHDGEEAPTSESS